ncbi:hypothetical protein ANTRET_LOCUS10967 [Anthophora retusa]
MWRMEGGLNKLTSGTGFTQSTYRTVRLSIRRSENRLFSCCLLSYAETEARTVQTGKRTERRRRSRERIRNTDTTEAEECSTVHRRSGRPD